MASRPAALLRLAALLAPLAIAGCASETTPDGYYEAVRQVRHNLMTPQGVRYADHVHTKTRTRLERIARRCAVQSRDQRGVRLLYRLDASGRPLETIAYPDTQLAHCIRDGLGALESFDLAPPPRRDYWIRLSVARLADAAGASDAGPCGPDPGPVGMGWFGYAAVPRGAGSCTDGAGLAATQDPV